MFSLEQKKFTATSGLAASFMSLLTDTNNIFSLKCALLLEYFCLIGDDSLKLCLLKVFLRMRGLDDNREEKHFFFFYPADTVMHNSASLKWLRCDSDCVEIPVGPLSSVQVLD